MKKLFLLVLVVIICAGELYSQAQTASITISSTVVSQLTFGTGRNMDFGLLTKNQSKHILPTEAASGRFEITGTVNKNVQVSFLLPGSLNNGGNSLSIGFQEGDAGYTSNSNGSGQTSFNPSQPTIINLGASGTVYIHLGATVIPALNQVLGTYSGTVTVSVQYTGS